MLKLTAAAAIAANIIAPASAKNNGLAVKPSMGINMWNSLFCNYNETDLKQIVDIVVEQGYLAAGYEYFNLDDCWQVSRDPTTHVIIPDPTKFPNGIQEFIAYVKGKGLKFGLYSDAGTNTCAGRPGGMGYETIDATTYASWGVDYLKYDNCNNNNVDPHVRYVAMSNALNASGRDIQFSACIWGTSNPWEWMEPYANSWRMDDDISNSWDSLLRVLSNAYGLSPYAGPGGWNDLDMLEVGNFNDDHSDAESAAHFALWALYKSPLLIGTDLRKASNATKAILQAPEIIAVSQDPLGVAGDLVWQHGPQRIYAGPLADGSRVVVMFNTHHYGSQYAFDNYTLPFEVIGYSDATHAVVRDMYAQQDLGSFTGSFPASVPLHGVLALKVTPTQEGELDTEWRPWHARKAAGKKEL